MAPLRRFARLAGRSMGQRPCFFGLSKPAQAGLEPRPSAPLAGGQHQWPGRAGSTVFLAQARCSEGICTPVGKVLP